MQTVQTSSCCLLNWAEGGGQGWLPGWARQVGSWIPTTSTKTTSSSSLQASQSNQPSFQTQAASWHLGSGLDLDSDSFSNRVHHHPDVKGPLYSYWTGTLPVFPPYQLLQHFHEYSTLTVEDCWKMDTLPSLSLVTADFWYVLIIFLLFHGYW